MQNVRPQHAARRAMSPDLFNHSTRSYERTRPVLFYPKAGADGRSTQPGKRKNACTGKSGNPEVDEAIRRESDLHPVQARPDHEDDLYNNRQIEFDGSSNAFNQV